MLNSPVDEIKSRLDIVDVIGSYIKLQKAGANYRAVCPFHSEKKPSFFVSPARQMWHCFGACGEGGDIFKFVMKIGGIEFGDALRILAQKAGVELKREDPKIRTERQRLYEITRLASLFYQNQLEKSKAGQEARKYLLDRNIKEETIKNWKLGYAPDVWQGLSDFLVGRGYKREEIEKAGLALKSSKSGNYYDRFRARIMFPILDLSSQVVGFGGRIFKQKLRPDNQEEAKYINTPATMLYDKSRILYGLFKAGVPIRKNGACVVVEGYMDAIMAHQAGTENVVATSGTALTSFQLKILKRYSENLYTAFDMDIAGDSATKRGIDLAQSLGFNIKVIKMPDGLDPADVAKEPENWQNLINNPKTIHDFYFETTFSRFDKNTLEGKKTISKLLLPIIKGIPNKIEQTFWIQSLASKLAVKEDDITTELKKISLDIPQRDFESPPPETEGALKNKIAGRSKKDLIEEHLVILAIKLPKNLESLNQEDFDILSEPTKALISDLKEKGFDYNNFSEEKKQIFNPLFLRAETFFDGEKIGKTKDEMDKITESEFINCLTLIKSLSIRKKLDFLCAEIKKAEQENNSLKLQELIEEFNRCSKSRCDLETA